MRGFGQLRPLFAFAIWIAFPALLLGSQQSPEGLWKGLIVYTPAELEVDIVVELARNDEGGWTGTIDLPNQHLELHPLENIQTNGSRVEFWFNRFAKHAGVQVDSSFEAELSENGQQMSGEFIEGGKNHHPFTLHRIAEPGMERPQRPVAPHQTLSDDSAALRERFNADSDQVRLVLLLSPT